MLITDLLGHHRRVDPAQKRFDLSLGCDACPLDGIPGINKVKGLSRIKQRRAMLWAQEPGRKENELKLELVGPAGQFLWEALDPLGLDRDTFDIQNILRCWPVNEDRIKHEPTKEELRCCSIYTEEALARNQQRAVVHLILGKVAANQLLGKDARQDRACFWHEPWNAYVVLADHPSYLLRKGGKKAGWDYFKFLDRLKAVKVILDHPGRWGYVKAQDYGSVITAAEMDNLEMIIRAEAKKGRRISVDIEDGLIAEKRVILLVGFGYGHYQSKTDWASWKGSARSVVLHHPGALQNTQRLDYLIDRIRSILEDPHIEKVLQHGSYDVRRIRSILDIRMRGYTFDTEYGTYLKHPYLRAFGLDAITGYFFPEFADYKLMVAPWMPDRLAACPLKTLVTYNCADADITKRQEVKIAPHISLPLLQVYIHAGFVLTAMQEHGPILDRQAYAKVAEVIPKQVELLKRRLCHVAGRTDFNPNTPQDIAWLLFKKLKLPRIAGNGTGKEVLETLALKTNSKVPRMVLDHRGLSKIQGTYMAGYLRSAEAHKGELRTIWWLTGAITGRLRSGGGKDSAALVNLQNLHGNAVLLDMLVSDRHWRRALEMAKK